MRTLFSYLTMLKHHDIISIPDSAKSVRNYNDSLASVFHKQVKGLLHLVFTLGIESTSSFVKK